MAPSLVSSPAGHQGQIIPEIERQGKFATEPDGLPLHPAQFVEPVPEPIQKSPGLRRGVGRQHTYPGHSPPWLRVGQKRRREDGEDQRHNDPNGTEPHGDLLLRHGLPLICSRTTQDQARGAASAFGVRNHRPPLVACIRWLGGRDPCESVSRALGGRDSTCGPDLIHVRGEGVFSDNPPECQDERR
jgi:hypothetical protein